MKNKPGTSKNPTNEPSAWRFDPPSPAIVVSESPEALFGRAAGLHQGGQLDLAEPLYRELLALQPDNGDALHLYGVLRYQQRDPAAAVPLIQAALKFIPANIFAWRLGLALLRLNRFQAALEAFTRSKSPDFAEALSKRAKLCRHSRQRKPAASTVLCATGQTMPRHSIVVALH
jgi:Tfp pilus assembly protein PilF